MTAATLQIRAEHELRQLLARKNYPCVAALRAYHGGHCRIQAGGRFGTGASWRELRSGLESFLAEQKATGSTLLTFLAVFEPEAAPSGEEEFEANLWHELSCLSSWEQLEEDWPEGAERAPGSQAFRFHLFGEEFFVVGLHPRSSRLARRFFAPALVFNVFRQFRELQARGQYAGMVRESRRRDLLHQGSVNPMAAAHGESWEAIQFSGRENPASWKCPFRFLRREEKP